MEDGICTDSLALETARKYGIDDDVMIRARDLSILFDKICRPNNSINEENGDYSVVDNKVSMNK